MKVNKRYTRPNPLVPPLMASLMSTACLLQSSPSFGKSFTVNRAFDYFSDSLCDSSCTLRDAVQSANNNPGPDTVKFASTMSGMVMNLYYGPIGINGPLTITGLGANRLALESDSGMADPDGATRIFDIAPAAAGTDVTITGLTLMDGSADQGGAIMHSDADLVLREVVITGNSATVSGGGIYSDGGSLTLENSVIEDNSAPVGGGIFFASSFYRADIGLRLARVTLRDNESTTGNGGGIYLDQPDGTTLITDTSFSDNQSAGDGGGLALHASSYTGVVTLRNSSFVGNSAAMDGGGLALDQPDARVLIENSSLYGNTATAGAGGGIHAQDAGGLLLLRGVTLSANDAGGNGGGLYTDVTHSILIQNSILDENTAAADDDLSASGFFAMNSLINNPGASTGSGFFISGRSALLNELADYGGPTLTRALDRGSPAVDGGDPNVCADLNANKDQRGQLRTVDADNDGNLTCDMGAFEFNGRSVNCDAVPLPAMSCKAALKGSLSIVDNAGTASDSMTLALTSLNTPSTTFFGNPTHFNGTANAVCVYVNTVAMMAPDRLIGSLNVPAGERNSKGLTPWTLTSAGKTSYSLSTGNIDGLTRLTQTPSSSMTTTTGSVLAAAKGNAFTVPAIPLMAPSALTVTVQNVTSGGACAEISFTGAEIKTFTFNRFTASQ